MPLDTIGSYALAGSSGAVARGARVGNTESPNSASLRAFAAPSARGGNTGGDEVEVGSASAGVAIYVSPFIRLDIRTRLAIVEIRNGETGEVQQQYPSPKVVREYQQNLPEQSDLRVESAPANEGSQADQPQIRLIGGGTGSGEPAPAVSFGSGGNARDTAPAPVPAPAPAPATARAAAAAAFNSLQNALTGGRQLAVA